MVTFAYASEHYDRVAVVVVVLAMVVSKRIDGPEWNIKMQLPAKQDSSSGFDFKNQFTPVLQTRTLFSISKSECGTCGNNRECSGVRVFRAGPITEPTFTCESGATLHTHPARLYYHASRVFVFYTCFKNGEKVVRSFPFPVCLVCSDIAATDDDYGRKEYCSLFPWRV